MPITRGQKHEDHTRVRPTRIRPCRRPDPDWLGQVCSPGRPYGEGSYTGHHHKPMLEGVRPTRRMLAVEDKAFMLATNHRGRSLARQCCVPPFPVLGVCSVVVTRWCPVSRWVLWGRGAGLPTIDFVRGSWSNAELDAGDEVRRSRPCCGDREVDVRGPLLGAG